MRLFYTQFAWFNSRVYGILFGDMTIVNGFIKQLIAEEHHIVSACLHPMLPCFTGNMMNNSEILWHHAFQTNPHVAYLRVCATRGPLACDNWHNWPILAYLEPRCWPLPIPTGWWFQPL